MKQTFFLNITGAQNGEWQGYITWQNDRVAEFQSLLELLSLVKSELEETKGRKG